MGLRLLGSSGRSQVCRVVEAVRAYVLYCLGRSGLTRGLRLIGSTVGALKIRIGFWGFLVMMIGIL